MQFSEHFIRVETFYSFQTFCSEAYERVVSNLNAIRDPSQLQNFKNMSEVSKSMCEVGHVVQGNPLGV